MTKKINIPSRWEDVTLEEFNILSNLQSNKIVDIIAALNQMDVNEVKQMDASVLTEAQESLKFLATTPKVAPTNSITINKETYKVNDLARMKVGEFADVQEIVQADRTAYAEILAVICRKEDEVYDDDFIANVLPQRIEMFKKMKVTECLGLVSFFLLARMMQNDSSRKHLESELHRASMQLVRKRNAWGRLTDSITRFRLRARETRLKRWKSIKCFLRRS